MYISLLLVEVIERFMKFLSSVSAHSFQLTHTHTHTKNRPTMAVTNPYSRQTSTTATSTAAATAPSSSFSSSSSPPTISASLPRQLLLLHHPNQRYTNDALSTSAELLRLIIIEAQRRAAIEAECESEVYVGHSQNSDGDVDSPLDRRVEIRAEHVAKIAAELLMDLS